MSATAIDADAALGPLLLPDTLDLAAAESFLELMRHRVNDEGPLQIDAAAVESITLPCIQIIFAALNSRDAVTIRNPSEEFINAFEDLGIAWMRFLEIAPEAQSEGQEDDRPEQQADPQVDPPAEPQAEQQTKPQQADLQSVEEAAGPIAPPAGDAVPSQPELKKVELEEISEGPMAKRILTIDDSKTMRDMLMLTLAEAGFDVLQAVDGQDGLDVLVNERVDVVITDINMPRMDGYEVIRQLRKNPAFKSTPILVLTTESETEKKNLARQAGATGWMVKPFDPDRLVETVRKVSP
jgi:two-component system chemotaxis response regulator CheY